MQIGPLNFRPSLLPTVAACLMLTLFISLASWQFDRASEKESAARSYIQFQAQEPRALATLAIEGLVGVTEPFQRVYARGNYRGDRQLLLDNRTYGGRAGYHVLTPFETNNGIWILVNRGWVLAPPDRRQLPDVRLRDSLPASVTVRGTLARAREDQFVLGDTGYTSNTWPRVVQRVELEQAGSTLGRPVFGMVLLLDPGAENGYVRAWSPYVGITPDRHRGYATQWLALAVTLVVIYLGLTLRSGGT